MALDIILKENEVKSFREPMEVEMNKAIKHLEGELIKIRSGRAHPSLIEGLQVTCYGGQPMALKGLATITAPEPRLITIQPWDANVIPDIEKAIVASDLGVSPVNDGAVVRIQLPEMSASRREELVKILGKKVEEARIAMRNVRKDFKNVLTEAKRNKEISENFINRLSDVLQEVTDAFIAKADKLEEKKKSELTSI